jgi:hypothetical protein
MPDLWLLLLVIFVECFYGSVFLDTNYSRRPCLVFVDFWSY